MAIYDNPIQLESEIRNPVPPLRRLLNAPSRLEVPKSERRRALLILHSLIRYAEAEGWTVSEPDDVRSRYRNSNPRDLVAIDAGHCTCMIRIRMKQVRVPHEKTEQEQRYGWARKWDYAQTDILRLEVRDDYDVTYFDDGVRRKVEEQIHRALKRIQAFSDRAHEREQKRMEAERIAAERRLEQERLVEKIKHYDAWAESVDELIEAWSRHEQRRESLLSIREENLTIGNEAVDRLLTWFDGRVAEANPILRFRLPTADEPELGYRERHNYVSAIAGEEDVIGDHSEVEKLNALLEQSAELLSKLLAAWLAVGVQLGQRPSPRSTVQVEVDEFNSLTPDAPANLGYAPGQLAGIYVGAMAKHVESLAALMHTRNIAGGVWPIVRAELELAGRVAWLLDSDLVEGAGRLRVARFYLELISSLQRERYTVGRYSRRLANGAKRDRDRILAEAVGVFGSEAVTIDFSSMECLDTWEIEGESLAGLGAGVTVFVDRCLTSGSGLYDSLSDFSHPSAVAILKQTEHVDVGGVTTLPYRVDPDLVDFQVRTSCTVLYKSAHLVAGYYGLDPSALEEWVHSTPESWFNG